MCGCVCIGVCVCNSPWLCLLQPAPLHVLLMTRSKERSPAIVFQEFFCSCDEATRSSCFIAFLSKSLGIGNAVTRINISPCVALDSPLFQSTNH